MGKILIVHYDDDFMEILQRWLHTKGLEAKYVKADEAISAVKEFKADVVLVDALQINVAKKIKQDKEVSNTPIVVMAGYTPVQQDYTLVADEVLHTPCEPKIIEEKIRKVLKKTG